MCIREPNIIKKLLESFMAKFLMDFLGKSSELFARLYAERATFFNRIFQISPEKSTQIPLEIFQEYMLTNIPSSLMQKSILMLS